MSEIIKDDNHQPKIWWDQQERILKKWGEIASSFRFIHNTLMFSWRRWSIAFALPIIILSTLTGSANFATKSFPTSMHEMLPIYIGAVNIVVGIMSTISRFLRVDELKESHAVASLGFGKLSRSIAVELSLPPEERSMNGNDFIQYVRNEMDRLLEQSPEIHPKVAEKFNLRFNNQPFQKPDICSISEIHIYKPTDQEKQQMQDLKNTDSVFERAMKQITRSIQYLEPVPDEEAAGGVEQIDHLNENDPGFM